MNYYGFSTEIIDGKASMVSDFFGQLCHLAEVEKNTCIFIFHVGESHIWLYNQWLRLPENQTLINQYLDNLKANKILVGCLIGGDGVGDYLHNVPNHRVFTDSTFFLKKTYHRVTYHIHKFRDMKISNRAQHTFDKVFICLNGSGRPHRLRFLDALEKNNLWKHGSITWYGNIDLSNHSTPLDIAKDRKWDPLKPYILESQASLGLNPNTFQHIFPTESLHSFLNIVTETSEDSRGFFLTEKTAYPLILGKPILVLGQRYFHRNLEQLGFALHKDIFDYSFDTMEKVEDRMQGIIDNVKKLVENKDKLIDYYQHIYPELSHNSRHVSYIANRHDSTWQHIKTVVNKMPMDQHSKEYMTLRMDELSCENICHPQVRLERAKKYAGMFPIILSDV